MTDGYKSMHRNAIWFGCLADWICSVGGMAERRGIVAIEAIVSYVSVGEGRF